MPDLQRYGSYAAPQHEEICSGQMNGDVSAFSSESFLSPRRLHRKIQMAFSPPPQLRHCLCLSTGDILENTAKSLESL